MTPKGQNGQELSDAKRPACKLNVDRYSTCYCMIRGHLKSLKYFKFKLIKLAITLLNKYIVIPLIVGNIGVLKSDKIRVLINGHLKEKATQV